MRIDNQIPVHTLANSSAYQNMRPNTPTPTVANADPAASQNTREQEQKIEQKQDARDDAVKNQIYDSSGQTNRLPGTVTLFDTTV